MEIYKDFFLVSLQSYETVLETEKIKNNYLMFTTLNQWEPENNAFSNGSSWARPISFSFESPVPRILFSE